MRAADVLPAAIARLREAGVDGAPRDARLLLAHAMGVLPDRLTLHLPDELAKEATQRFELAITARCARQPLAQIIGQRTFFGRQFRVTREVLDPRPETETLVLAALEGPFTRILDLGTGSGAILLTLLAERPHATGIGVDISAPALAVAQRNAEALDLAERAQFVVSDWLLDVEGSFDLIVSNPPYIAEDEMSALSPEVRDWEPHLALSPGGDGLDAYRRILAGAPAYLQAGGRLMVEVGPTQGAEVAKLMERTGLHDIRIAPDLDDRQRVVAARKPL